MDEQQDLRRHYGPTDTDPDPGKMWHYGCGGEVLAIEEAYCCSCDAQSSMAEGRADLR